MKEAEHRSIRFNVDPAFAHALNSVNQGIAFYDRQGGLVYRNDWLERALRYPHGRELQIALTNFVVELLSEPLPLDGRVRRIAELELPVKMRPARRLTGSHIGHDLFGLGSTFFVSIETSSELLPDAALIQRRFELTPAETRVAFYLAEGLSTEEVGDVLGISPHTVRRHTERVLSKLGISTRDDIRSRLTTESKDYASPHPGGSWPSWHSELP